MNIGKKGLERSEIEVVAIATTDTSRTTALIPPVDLDLKKRDEEDEQGLKKHQELSREIEKNYHLLNSHPHPFLKVTSQH